MRTDKFIWVLAISLILLIPIHARERGAWIATVANIDWPAVEAVGNDSAQQAAMVGILDSLQQAGMNFVIFQVRPTADALYESELEPWSHWLSGQQGVGPSYDPLDFVITEAHKRDMAVHAWVNPYRVNIAIMDTSVLCSSHLMRQHPNWFWRYGKQFYFNPALDEPREWLCMVVEDIVCRYEVDAIHMDDYFYPYPQGKQQLPDMADYLSDPRGFEDIADWRRDNVNKTIEALSETIRSTKSNVAFGISPFGIYKGGAGLNNYCDLYADVIYWIEQGWIDYVAPQLYWEISDKFTDYVTLTKWWAEAVEQANHRYLLNHVMSPVTHEPCKLYIGLAVYRLGGGKENPAWREGNEIMRQLRFNQTVDKLDGEIFYSTRPLLNNPRHLLDSLFLNL